MIKYIERTLYFLLGLYAIGIAWTFQQLWDKESLIMVVMDSVAWPYFWYQVLVL